jgi:hypothetical protein
MGGGQQILYSITDYSPMSDREVGRTLTFVGAILGIIGGVVWILAGLIGGALASATSFYRIPDYSIGAGAAIAVLIVLGLIQIIISYGMIEISRRRRKGDHVINGIVILVLSIILFFLGGGFIIGPILSGIGGILIML